MPKTFFKITLILLGISLPVVMARAQETASQETLCTQETLPECYEKAKAFYLNQQFEEAKTLFEKIIAIDAGYKQTASYLKKSHSQLAKKAIQEHTAAQREKLKEERQKESEAKKEAKRLEKELALQKKKKAKEKIETEEAAPTAEATPPVEEETAPAPEETPKPLIYRIGIGDVLDISVWRTAELDKSVIVRPDGIISYPLVGDIPAAGLTLTELDERLTEALREFVRSPEVSVAIARFGGTKVILLGEIKTPGVVAIPGRGNLIDVIALGGGFTNDAVKRGVIVVRGGLEHPEVYRLNVARIFKGDLSQNIQVEPNDIIYVPRQFIADFNIAINRITPLLSNTLLGTSVYRDIKDLVKGTSTTK